MTAGHKVECLADDVAWGDELRLPGDVLVEGHVWKSALRPLLGIRDQGGGLPGACKHHYFHHLERPHFVS